MHNSHLSAARCDCHEWQIRLSTLLQKKISIMFTLLYFGVTIKMKDGLDPKGCTLNIDY